MIFFSRSAVERAHVNKLEIRLPSLTRLNNDPVTIFLDRIHLDLREPKEGRTIQTPLSGMLSLFLVMLMMVLSLYCTHLLSRPLVIKLFRSLGETT